MCGPAKRTWCLSPDKMFCEGEQSLNLEEVLRAYDAALKKVSLAYCNQMHNLALNNCHSHVATLLNEISYDGRRNWNQLRVFYALWRHGHWVRKTVAFRAFAPFFLILSLLIILCCALTFGLG